MKRIYALLLITATYVSEVKTSEKIGMDIDPIETEKAPSLQNLIVKWQNARTRKKPKALQNINNLINRLKDDEIAKQIKNWPLKNLLWLAKNTHTPYNEKKILTPITTVLFTSEPSKPTIKEQITTLSLQDLAELWCVELMEEELLKTQIQAIQKRIKDNTEEAIQQLNLRQFFALLQIELPEIYTNKIQNAFNKKLERTSIKKLEEEIRDCNLNKELLETFLDKNNKKLQTAIKDTLAQNADKISPQELADIYSILQEKNMETSAIEKELTKPEKIVDAPLEFFFKLLKTQGEKAQLAKNKILQKSLEFASNEEQYIEEQDKCAIESLSIEELKTYLKMLLSTKREDIIGLEDLDLEDFPINFFSKQNEKQPYTWKSYFIRFIIKTLYKELSESPNKEKTGEIFDVIPYITEEQLPELINYILELYIKMPMATQQKMQNVLLQTFQKTLEARTSYVLLIDLHDLIGQTPNLAFLKNEIIKKIDSESLSSFLNTVEILEKYIKTTPNINDNRIFHIMKNLDDIIQKKLDWFIEKNRTDKLFEHLEKSQIVTLYVWMSTEQRITLIPTETDRIVEALLSFPKEKIFNTLNSLEPFSAIILYENTPLSKKKAMGDILKKYTLDKIEKLQDVATVLEFYEQIARCKIPRTKEFLEPIIEKYVQKKLIKKNISFILKLIGKIGPNEHSSVLVNVAKEIIPNKLYAALRKKELSQIVSFFKNLTQKQLLWLFLVSNEAQKKYYHQMLKNKLTTELQNKPSEPIIYLWAKNQYSPLMTELVKNKIPQMSANRFWEIIHEINYTGFPFQH